MKNIRYLGEARNFLHVTVRNVGVKKYPLFSIQHRDIVVELSYGPKLFVPDPKPIIGNVSYEVVTFIIEFLLLILWSV